MKLRYHEPSPISRDEVHAVLASDNENLICHALIRMSLHESDWEWAEQICLSRLADSRKGIRHAALVGLGHLARIHRSIHLEIVIPSVRRLLNDVDLSGIAEDTLAEIAQYVPSREC